MTELAVLVPVLARPHRVRPLLTAFGVANPDAAVLFIADPHDLEEIEALETEGAEYIAPGGNYAAKIRAGVEATDEPLIFTAADDLLPHGGWFETAKSYLSDEIQVVGVNDLCSQRVMNGTHATHFLMTREYALEPCIDGSPGPFFQGYDHSAVDDEFFATAQHRSVLAVASDSVVEHLHPDNGGSEWDATYVKGRARIRKDLRLFRARSDQWLR